MEDTAGALTYPDTLYSPGPAVDLGDAREQARLSGPALKAFFRVMEAWGVRDREAKRLLGGVSNGRFYALKRDAGARTLSVDELTRVSLVVGIYKALHILYDETLADRWMGLPNKNRLFGGRPALDYAAEGGIAGLILVRRLLDARRGFLA